MIRRAVADDIPHIVELAKARYGAFHEENVRDWLNKAVVMDNYLVLIGERCAGVCTVHPFFYNPSELHATQLYEVAAPGAGWEPYKLFKGLVNWALADKGAIEYHFGSATSTDLSPFAKRYGAELDRPSWVIRNGPNFR